jgi:phosphoglycolate phosphatase-like HAD superfamily hydrolase
VTVAAPTTARAVLFDLDGTLLWLAVDIERVRRELSGLFAPRGFDGRFAPVLPSIEEAARTVAGSEAERRALVRQGRGLLDAAELTAARSSRARGGAGPLLAELAARGIEWGVITDNGAACAAPALATAGLAPPAVPRVVVTRDDVDRPKPDPGGVARAARGLLPAGGLLWLVGDHPRDVAAAIAARPLLDGVDVRAAALLGGRGAADALRAAGADTVIGDLHEVAGLLGLGAAAAG